MLFDKVPRKRINQDIQNSKGYLRRQIWTHPAVSSTTAVHAAINSAVVVTTGITNPDFPRILTIVGAGSGHNAAGTVTINGTDIRGTVISDAIVLNSNTTVSGVKAFKTVTSIDFTAVTGQDANNTVAIGTGAKLGLDRMCAGDETILGTVDGTKEATVPVITSGATIALNVISFNTTLANTKVFVADYVANEVTQGVGTTA